MLLGYVGKLIIILLENNLVLDNLYGSFAEVENIKENFLKAWIEEIKKSTVHFEGQEKDYKAQHTYSK